KEILVAPALVAGMIVGSESSERFAAAAVKVRRVLFEAVVGRQVHPAAEPPYRPEIRGCDFVAFVGGSSPYVLVLSRRHLLGFASRSRISGRDANAKHPGQRDEQAHVHVHGRHVGIARMQYHGDAHYFECASRKLRPRGGRGSRKLAASYVREIDSAALEHLSLLDDAGDSAAALPLPHVASNAGAVERFEAAHDSCLVVDEIIACAGAFHGCRRTMSGNRADAARA